MVVVVVVVVVVLSVMVFSMIIFLQTNTIMSAGVTSHLRLKNAVTPAEIVSINAEVVSIFAFICHGCLA